MDYNKAASYWIEKDKNAVKMERQALKAKIDAFIGRHKTCALAVADKDFVRCTPIEYNYLEDCFWLFSEGGLKFKALKNNKNVCLAIYDEYAGFGKLGGMQVTGIAEVVEPWSEEYVKLLEFKKLSIEAMKKLPFTMNLIKVKPSVIDILDSSLKKEGVNSRQQYQFEE